MIHAYGGNPEPSLPDLCPNFSIYAGKSSRQRLYMYYTSPDGKKEYPQNATIRLWDDESDELLAEFSRITEEEWDTRYLPSYSSVSDNINEYSIHLRLEVNIPGMQTIVARTHLERTICIDSWQGYGFGKAHYVKQKATLSGPVWFLPEAIEIEHEVLATDYMIGYYGEYTYIKHLPVRFLRTNYTFADFFNYKDDAFMYGIRVLPRNDGGDKHYTIQMDEWQDSKPVDESHQTVYSTMIHLTYVSEEYDKYLKDAIVYRMRHDNENDPLLHLYEDQIYSNIEGGCGIFGSEVVVYDPVTIQD